ncbi:hypothetical protein Tco_0453519 [Tanacetum coccineum]
MFLELLLLRYAVTVNPTIYNTCIEQFWAIAKVKTVNGERQIQALVDKKRVIITKTSIRSDLKLEDAEGTDCLPIATIFVKLERMSAKTTAWNEFSSTMASAIISPEDMGEDSAAPTDSHFTPIITQPSSSKPQKKLSIRKYRKDSGPTEPIPDEANNEEHVSIPSYDLPQSGEDRLQLTELMSLCTSLQEKVLDLEKAKTAQAKKIASLKKRVKQLEKRKKLRTSRLKRLRKGRKIADLDADEEVTLIDETQERNDEEMLFDVQDDLQGEEVVAEKVVAEKQVSAADPVTTAGEVVTTANVEVTTASAPTTTIDELTLAQTIIEIKAAKPKAVTTAATTTTTTRPKARGVVVQDPSEFKTISTPSQASQLP